MALFPRPDQENDSVVGALLSPAWTDKEALLVRLMQENADFRLENERLQRLAMRPHELVQMVESLNRVAHVASSPLVREEIEAAMLRVLQLVAAKPDERLYAQPM